MKKKIMLVCIIVLVFLCAAFAVSCKNDKIVLNVYNWGEYISDGSEGSYDVNAEFEAFCKEQGLNVEVNYMMFDSNETMYNKLTSGAVSYDVIIPSDYMVARLINEGMLEELNYENIPNFANIDPNFVAPYYDPEQKYSIPYFVGYVGIIYNTKFVDESDIGTWDLLWNEKYKGKILQFNNSRDALGTAMFKIGADVNTKEGSVWRAALDELKKQKPLLQAYVMDEIFNKMENESAWIAPYYAGDFLSMYEDNPNLGFYFPEGSTNVFNDAMCIPKGAKNKEIAEMYINFMLRAEVGRANSEFVYYATPNMLVNSDPEYNETMADIYEDAMYCLAPDFPEDYKAQYFYNLDDATLVMVNSLWEELKIDSGSGEDELPSDFGVYVTCVVIIVAIAAIFISRFAVKCKRKKYY